MCYAKPGPRCSTHVRADLDKATQKANQSPTPENLDAVNKLQKDYDSTKKGQEELENTINDLLFESIDEENYDEEKDAARTLQIEILENRLSRGKEIRDAQMTAYRDKNNPRFKVRSRDGVFSVQTPGGIKTFDEDQAYSLLGELSSQVRDERGNLRSGVKEVQLKSFDETLSFAEADMLHTTLADKWQEYDTEKIVENARKNAEEIFKDLLN